METQIKAATRARGQATRHDLMNIARRLFSEHGFSGTALADIQQASGLTKGAFYHHFRSKEDMALALLESARAEYERRLIAPAMAAWVREGTHRLDTWETDWSSQTGACQAGILHGNNREMPAFRSRLTETEAKSIAAWVYRQANPSGASR